MTVALAVSLALLASLMWAVVGHLNKFLLTKVSKQSSIESIMIFSTLIFGLVMLPASLIYTKFDIAWDWQTVGLVLAAAIIYALANYLYFQSMEVGDTTVVTALYQLVPVFSFGLAVLVFNETFSASQIVGGLIIIISAILISVDTKNLKLSHVSRQVLWQMGLVGLLFAAYYKLISIASADIGYGSTINIFHASFIIIGLVLWLRPRYRQSFVDLVKQNGRIFVSLNIVNEILNALAVILTNYVILFLPIAIVNTLNGFQAAFVLIIGLIGAKFWPKTFDDQNTTTVIFQKTIFILTSIAGLLLLLR